MYKVKKGLAKNKPIRANIAKLKIPILMLVLAALLASSNLLAPSLLAISELTPTALPTATEIISICIGSISETAVSAF